MDRDPLRYLPFLFSSVCLAAGFLTALTRVDCVLAADAATAIRSHPPMRPQPGPSARPMSPGPAYFVDPLQGDDLAAGSREKPWRTLRHAVEQLQPGDTLYLRGGTYYESVTLTAAGAAGRPITIRSHPGELAVLDGGLREFFENPAEAWEPWAEGAEGEFRSTQVYHGLGDTVLGNFGDSMVPLHGYRNLLDLRSANEYWNLEGKLDVESGIYCGPGVWYDRDTGRLHVRLAHTTLEVLADDNYRGQTDPRLLPLVIAGGRIPLGIQGSKHLRLQDLVVRGSAGATLHVDGAEDIELDGVTVYGGSPALDVQGTRRLRMAHTALRGISAPWSFRTSHKYRGVAAYLLTSRGDGRPNRDFEIAYSELTDSHDGPFLGTVQGLKFHHNLVDNFNDDGIYLTSMERGGDIHIYQNRLSRCLHVLAFFGSYQPGTGVYIYRNVIDLRPPVHYFQPSSPDDPQFPPGAPGGRRRVVTRGRLCGDHGSPVWEPINFYHNTVLATEGAFRDYYAAGWGGHTSGTTRRVFNNIFVQVEGYPGLNFASLDDDLAADGNLLWGVKEGPTFEGDFFAPLQQSGGFQTTKQRYQPGWTSHDLFADPRFVQFDPDGSLPLDVRLRPDSPAAEAGIDLPLDWADPLREADQGRPDMGALPLGAQPFEAGPSRGPAPP